MLLARAGHDVVLFERRTRAEATGSAGRSINLAVPLSMLDTLLDLGVDEELARTCVPLRGRVTHGLSGERTFRPYDEPGADVHESPLQPGEPPVSIGRSALLSSLLRLAETEPGLRLQFEHRLVDADLDAGQLRFAGSGTSGGSAEVELVVGADGANSVVRAIMARRPSFRLDVRYSGIGYRELRLPTGKGGSSLQAETFHLWPREGCLLVALPNADASFTFTMFAGSKASPYLDAVNDPRALVDLLERDFPDLVDNPRALTSEDVTVMGDAHRLMDVRCRPWHQGRAVLVGDACHAMLPFSGRGTSEGIADAVELAASLQAVAGEDPGEAFEAYAGRRRPVADALGSFARALAPLLLTMLPGSGVTAEL